MGQENKTQKSIEDENLYLLNINASLGKFKFRENITEYNLGKYAFIPKDNEDDIWDTYNLDEPKISIFTDSEKNICSIRCNYKCYYEGQNLTGMAYADFLKLTNEVPNSEDLIYVIRAQKGQNQKVYDFDSLGLQIWVYRNKVVTVFCSRW